MFVLALLQWEKKLELKENGPIREVVRLLSWSEISHRAYTVYINYIAMLVLVVNKNVLTSLTL